MEVARWLLQYDYSDFNGPLVRIEEWYEALSDAYTYHQNNPASSNALACAEKAQALILTRLLVEHLNKPARINLKKKFTQQNNQSIV